MKIVVVTLYLVILVPLGLILRPLWRRHLKIERGATTYWTERRPSGPMTSQW